MLNHRTSIQEDTKFEELVAGLKNAFEAVDAAIAGGVQQGEVVLAAKNLVDALKAHPYSPTEWSTFMRVLDMAILNYCLKNRAGYSLTPPNVSEAPANEDVECVNCANEAKLPKENDNGK